MLSICIELNSTTPLNFLWILLTAHAASHIMVQWKGNWPKPLVHLHLVMSHINVQVRTHERYRYIQEYPLRNYFTIDPDEFSFFESFAC